MPRLIDWAGAVSALVIGLWSKAVLADEQCAPTEPTPAFVFRGDERDWRFRFATDLGSSFEPPVGDPVCSTLVCISPQPYSCGFPPQGWPWCVPSEGPPQRGVRGGWCSWADYFFNGDIILTQWDVGEADLHGAANMPTTFCQTSVILTATFLGYNENGGRFYDGFWECTARDAVGRFIAEEWPHVVEVPSPTPTWTPRPTFTPSVTATVTATATSSPTASPTCTASATVTATASPSSSATPEPSVTPTDTSTVSSSFTATATPTRPAPSLTATARPITEVPSLCPGDCGLRRRVTIDNLLAAVSIALGNRPLDTCSAADQNGDGRVGIAELVAAVSAALSGCP